MWADNETDKDLLGFQVHADLLKSIVLDKTMLPISIGIFGNWGSGKSSLMLQLQQALDKWPEGETKTELKKDPTKKNDRILQIKFNSWQFENYENTKLTLIETVLNCLTTDINEHKDIFEKFEEFLVRIKYLRAGVWILKKLIPDNIKNSFFPTEEELKSFVAPTEAKALIEEMGKGNTSRFIGMFHKCFEDLVIAADYRAIVVYIDDLDRCAPERVIDCLEAVKLFLNVKRTAFIIGADVRIIEYAIKNRYQYQLETEKTEKFSPFSDYLEKLIQLPYKLPKLSYGEQETYITLLLCSKEFPNSFAEIYTEYQVFRKTEKHLKYPLAKIKEKHPHLGFSTVQERLKIIPLMTQFLNGNPRQLKRFLNTYDVRRRLAEVAGFQDIKDTILVKLMVLEYNSRYSNRFENLYQLQQRGNGLIAEIKEVENAVKTESPFPANWEKLWNTDWLKQWLAAKPSLSKVDLQNYFWISRDALENEIPIDALVSSYVSLIYRNLYSYTSLTSLTKNIKTDVIKLDSHDKDMLALLLNKDLRLNAEDEHVWQILNCDENNILFDHELERLKLLFENVDSKQITAQASFFIKKMMKIEEFSIYIALLKSSFGKELKNALIRLMRKSPWIKITHV